MSKLILLKTKSDFNQFRPSRAVSNKSLTIRFVTKGQSFPRFGFIIPKKVLPKVVDRNKIKRRLKSLLQKQLLHIKGSDYLIFPQKQTIKLKYQDLEVALINALNKAGLWEP